MRLFGDHSRGWFVAALLLCLVALEGPGYSQNATTPTSATSGTSSGLGLVSRLTKGLSVTPTQARGGAGALFSLAKTRLTQEEFAKVASAVPGMSSLLKAAPEVGGNSGLSSLESELPGNTGRLVEVADTFHKLGMSPGMAEKFVPVMTNYVKSRGGLSTASLLEKALK